MVTEVEKNRHKCLMVMEGTLKHEGSDTRCMFPSGEKCPYQNGWSQQDAVNCMSLKWCISSLGRGVRALGDHTVKTHGFQWCMQGVIMQSGASGLSENHSSLLSSALACHSVVIFRTLRVLMHIFYLKKQTNKTSSVLVYTFPYDGVPKCRAAEAPSHLMSVCKMSAWSSALARFPQEYALILCYGFCCSSMWRETH